MGFRRESGRAAYFDDFFGILFGFKERECGSGLFFGGKRSCGVWREDCGKVVAVAAA